MNENGTNKKVIVGILVAMFVLLIPVTIFLFQPGTTDPQPTEPVLQVSSSVTTVPTTAAPTTAPTVQPTQPANPTGNALYIDKQLYNTNETVTFNCISLSGMSTLWVTYPDGSTKSYSDVSAAFTLKMTTAGAYSAYLETITNQSVIKSEVVQFVVVKPVTAKPTTKKPTTKPATVAPTTVKPTTVVPTTAAPTTVASTTVKPTTAAPTTVASTTVKPTTAAPTTVASTTVAPTTVKPTTVKSTTAAPTTVKPTTVAPTTVKPTTVAPTTVKPTTKPTTAKPTTVKPTVDMNGTFYITENGAAKATVVFSENFTEKTANALADLLDYIERISGATLDYMMDNEPLEQDRFYILLGPTRFHSELGIEIPKGYPNNEKLIVQRKGNVLALIGNDDGAFTGTQFAVTRFLEELGCGWFAPETQPLWTVVPENDTITIEDMDIVETPKFISRSNRLMTFNAHSANLARRWYMGGVETLVGQHFLMAYVDVQTYKNSNPEWYAKNSNGLYKEPSDGWWQFCYSNSSLHQKVAQVVGDYFDKNPNCMVFSITANDGGDIGICECSKCRTYSSDTDLLIDFANGVAKLLKSKYPDRQVNFLSYAPTVFAPASNHYLESNVELMLCAETSVTKPISQTTNVGLHAWRRNVAWMTNARNYISRTNAKNISVWKWLCIAAENAAWANIPWVQGNVATLDHDQWISLGAKYVFYDQGPLTAYREYDNSFSLRWPLWYVANRGCWSQDKTGEQLLQEACDKLYGAGSSAMMSYYKALANASAASNGDSVAWVMCKPTEVYTAAQIRIIDQRIAACKNMLSQVTADQAKRMQNQISLWETAKASYIK